MKTTNTPVFNIPSILLCSTREIWFLINSEANASELREHLEDTFSLYCMWVIFNVDPIYGTTQYCLSSLKGQCGCVFPVLKELYIEKNTKKISLVRKAFNTFFYWIIVYSMSIQFFDKPLHISYHSIDTFSGAYVIELLVVLR